MYVCMYTKEKFPDGCCCSPLQTKKRKEKGKGTFDRHSFGIIIFFIVFFFMTS